MSVISSRLIINTLKVFKYLILWVSTNPVPTTGPFSNQMDFEVYLVHLSATLCLQPKIQKKLYKQFEKYCNL